MPSSIIIDISKELDLGRGIIVGRRRDIDGGADIGIKIVVIRGIDETRGKK